MVSRKRVKPNDLDENHRFMGHNHQLLRSWYSIYNIHIRYVNIIFILDSDKNVDFYLQQELNKIVFIIFCHRFEWRSSRHICAQSFEVN